jgi:hypothetical protein
MDCHVEVSANRKDDAGRPETHYGRIWRMLHRWPAEVRREAASSGSVARLHDDELLDLASGHPNFRHQRSNLSRRGSSGAPALAKFRTRNRIRASTCF